MSIYLHNLYLRKGHTIGYNTSCKHGTIDFDNNNYTLSGGCLRFEGNTRGINSTERNFISECQVKKQFQDTNILLW